ncbi:MAG: phosphoribosyltransferase family protein [Planctomycetota bacterium]|nr:phosphoribosyltransferase family protein [Planctomycetota bacterium]
MNVQQFLNSGRQKLATIRSRKLPNWTQQLRQASRHVAGQTLDLLYPPQCADCATGLTTSQQPMLCEPCTVKLLADRLPKCDRCASSITELDAGAPDCIRCRKEKYQFERVLALGRYQDALREAVLKTKYPTEEPLTRALGTLLVERFGLQLRAWQPDVFVPIPMHWTRRLKRRGNSPDVLAEILAKQLNIALGNGALVRRRRTQPHRELSFRERKANMRDAFSVAAGCDFRDARVVLVDDILTTGTTCNVAARTLKKAGAAEVMVVVVARAHVGD